MKFVMVNYAKGCKTALFSSLACYLFLTGCTSTPSTPSNLGHHSLYLDYSSVDTPSFVMEGLNPECKNNTLNYSLKVSLQITNKEQKAAEYLFKNPSLKDETLGGQYKVTTQNEKVTVDPGMTRDISFSSTIPLSITEHKYKLSFDMNGYQIDYHLYERPDEVRSEWKVNYYVGGTLVKTDTVRDGKAPEHFTYESSDLLSYCREWYTDEAKTKYFTFPTPVTSDINLYGDAAQWYKWDTSSYADYANLYGVNYVPANGTLMLPRHYENKEIYIGSYAITGTSIEILYIPITVRRIEGSGNFQKKSMTIYYEGTEEQWNSVLQNSKSNPPNLIFMNGNGFPY